MSAKKRGRKMKSAFRKRKEAVKRMREIGAAVAAHCKAIVVATSSQRRAIRNLQTGGIVVRSEYKPIVLEKPSDTPRYSPALSRLCVGEKYTELLIVGEGFREEV